MQHARFFESAVCPDFAASQAPSQQLARPFSANSQCGKLLAALEAGRTLTTLEAIRITGGTEGARRLREVRKYLTSAGIKLESKCITTPNGARIKAFWINK